MLVLQKVNYIKNYRDLIDFTLTCLTFPRESPTGYRRISRKISLEERIQDCDSTVSSIFTIDYTFFSKLQANYLCEIAKFPHENFKELVRFQGLYLFLIENYWSFCLVLYIFSYSIFLFLFSLDLILIIVFTLNI